MNQSTLEQLRGYFFDEQYPIEIHKSKAQQIPDDQLRRFRLICWLLISLVYGWQVIFSDSLFIQIAYLTSHGLALTWLYFGLIIQDHYFKSSRKADAHHKDLRLQFWIELIYETAICLQVPITILYWFFMFFPSIKFVSISYLSLFILEHTIPLLLLGLQFKYNSCSFKLSRLILILIYGTIYLVLNIVYTRSVEPLYYILTWKNYTSVIYAVLALILIIATFLTLKKLKQSNKKRQAYNITIDRSQTSHTQLTNKNK